MQILGGIPFIILQNDTWTTNKQWKMRWRANPLISWGVSYVRCFEECWHDWMQNQVHTALHPPPCHTSFSATLLSPCFQASCWDGPAVDGHYEGTAVSPGQNQHRHLSAASLPLPPFFTCFSATVLSPCFPASCWDGPAVDGHYEGTAVSSGQNQHRHLSAASSSSSSLSYIFLSKPTVALFSSQLLRWPSCWQTLWGDCCQPRAESSTGTSPPPLPGRQQTPQRGRTRVTGPVTSQLCMWRTCFTRRWWNTLWWRSHPSRSGEW